MYIHDADCPEETLDNGVKRKIKGYIDDLMLVELTWQAGMVGAIHSHPHRQCGYVIQGSFEGTVSGKKTLLKKGDCYYANGGEEHGLTALEDESVLLDVFTPKRDDFVAQLAAIQNI